MAIEPGALDKVCDHLGHTNAVQKEYYRATSDTAERIDIGKILLIQEELEDIQFEGFFLVPYIYSTGTQKQFEEAFKR